MQNSLSHLTRILLIAACSIALFIALFGTVDAISTFILGQPIPLARELPEELLPLIIFLALPQVVQDDRNISVDFLVEGAPAKVKRLLEVLALMIAFCLFCFMAVQAAQSAIKSVEIKEAADAIYRFPVWPMKCLMVLGLAVASLQCITRSIKVLHREAQSRVVN